MFVNPEPCRCQQVHGRQCRGGSPGGDGDIELELGPGDADDVRDQAHDPGPVGVGERVVDQPGQRRQQWVGARRVVAPAFAGEVGGHLHEARTLAGVAMLPGGEHGHDVGEGDGWGDGLHGASRATDRRACPARPLTMRSLSHPAPDADRFAIRGVSSAGDAGRVPELLSTFGLPGLAERVDGRPSDGGRKPSVRKRSRANRGRPGG